MKLKHGHARRGQSTQAYRAWKDMNKRCNQPSFVKWARYGGRGIKVCERWVEYAAFFEDMGEPPTPNHSLDRRDNDGNYEPRNCRWATKAEQMVNRACNRFFTHDGRTLTVSQWSAEIGMSYIKLYKRLCSRGWPIAKALRP